MTLDPENYISQLNNILSSYPDINIKDLILFKKFCRFYFSKSLSDAANCLAALENSYPESALTVEARRLFGEENSSPQSPNGNASNSSNISLANYPNPFNPLTKIAYSLPIASKINLTIYDILGREIAVLVNEQKEAGNYEVSFNASHLASGIYIYRLSTSNKVAVRKMLLIK